MYPAVRVSLILLGLLSALVPAWLAGRIVSGNLEVLKSWKRTDAVVFGLALDTYVEVSLSGESDAPRVNVPVDHHLGLRFLKKVPIYVDPADPARMRTGGLLQMWLWPSGLVVAAVILLAVAGIAARIGRGSAPLDESTSHWMFSAPPAPLQTDIRIYRPASEWKVPLVWSLLGVAALSCGVLIRSAGQIPRIGLGSLGLLFMFLMWALALDGKTTEISADQNGMRKSTAFGWRQIRWQQLGSVEKRHTIFGRRESLLRQGSTDWSPGRDVTTVVFVDRGGWTLITMSESMQPRAMVVKLLDLCAARTGLHMEFRKLYSPNL